MERIQRGIQRVSPTVVRERVVVLWSVYTFLAGVLNFLALSQALQFILSLQPPPLPMFESLVGKVLFAFGLVMAMFVILFLLPIGISAVASQVLPQKRYVAILDVNLVTAGIYLYQVGSLHWPFPDTFYAGLGIIFLPLLGMVADVLGRRYIGLGERETFQDVYTVNAQLKQIDSILVRKEMQRAFGLRNRQASKDGKLVFYRNNAVDYRFFVVLVELADNYTLIDFEGYDILRYVIEGTKESKRRYDRDVNDLVEVLKNEKKLEVRKAGYDDAGLYKSAIDGIVLEPARPTFPTITRLPRSTIAILLGIVALVGTAYLLFLDRNFTPESFLTALFGLSSLLVGLIPFMRWTPKRKGWETVE